MNSEHAEHGNSTRKVYPTVPFRLRDSARRIQIFWLCALPNSGDDTLFSFESGPFFDNRVLRGHPSPGWISPATGWVDQASEDKVAVAFD